MNWRIVTWVTITVVCPSQRFRQLEAEFNGSENSDKGFAIMRSLHRFSTTIFTAFAVLAIALALSSCKGGGTDVTDPAALRGGEDRATLAPYNFNGATAKAYWIAKEIPEVLDSLYCYCDCKKHFGHKSLLTCYVDTHAAYCDVCMEEAFMAYDLHQQGMDVISIRKAVDEKFSKLRH